MSIFVGTAGFSYKDWEGIFYPPGLKKNKIHPLEYFARFFDVCEINTSFYGPISPKSAKEWCAKVAVVNSGFRFTAKLYQAFTHSPRGTAVPSPFDLRVSAEEEKRTREGFDAIATEGRLGAVLIQFPISFKNQDDTRDYLFRLIQKFREYPLVLEIRHESWNEADILERLAEAGVAFCNIDQPLIGKGIGSTEHVTARLGYVRLHGRNYQEWFAAKAPHDRYNYLYKPGELESWKAKIEKISRKTEEVYVIANNHYESRAAANAAEIKSMLSGSKVRAPKSLITRYPDLEEFAEPE